MTLAEKPVCSQTGLRVDKTALLRKLHYHSLPISHGLSFDEPVCRESHKAATHSLLVLRYHKTLLQKTAVSRTARWLGNHNVNAWQEQTVVLLNIALLAMWQIIMISVVEEIVVLLTICWSWGEVLRTDFSNPHILLIMSWNSLIRAITMPLTNCWSWEDSEWNYLGKNAMLLTFY